QKQQYWVHLTTDERDITEVLTIGGEALGSTLQNDFKQAVANSIAHKKSIRLEKERLKDRNARCDYMRQQLKKLPENQAQAADEIGKILFMLRYAKESKTANNEIRPKARELTKFYLYNDPTVDSTNLERWMRDAFDTDLPAPNIEFEHNTVAL